MKTAIHTIIKNEPDVYLKVWLDHHTKMVDHIFIIEDIDSWSHKHLTDKYDNVTLLSGADICSKQSLLDNKANGRDNQRPLLKEGVMYIKGLKQYDWLFTLDIDEFITLQPPYKAISDVLGAFQDKDGVLLQWMNYGASGRIYKPNYNGRDYREFYTIPANDTNWDEKACANTKIAWNLNLITRWNVTGLHCLAGNWTKTNGEKNRKKKVYDKMYLSHYITRSWEEYIWKRYIRGMHSGNRHRNDDDFFEVNPDMLPIKDKLLEIKEKILKDYGKEFT